jgi:DNA-binding MarR family transcriptional regulator
MKGHPDRRKRGQEKTEAEQSTDNGEAPPISGIDHEITAAMNGVRRIVRAIRLSSRASEKALGVSAAQLFVLQQLAERPDAAPSIAQLASLTATDPSSVSVVVSRLAARGLCIRKASKADGRRAEVTITEAGTELLARSPQPLQSRMLDALTAMPAERRRALVDGLEELVIALGVTDQTASMFFEDEGERAEDGKWVGAHENISSEPKPGR